MSKIRTFFMCVPIMILALVIIANVGREDVRAQGDDGAIVTIDITESVNIGDAGDLVLETTTGVSKQPQVKGETTKYNSNKEKIIKAKRAKILSAKRKYTENGVKEKL